MKKTLLLALIPFLSGCGFAFVKGPPSGWQEIQDVDGLVTRALIQPCTSSRTLVWVDAAVALGGVSGFLEVGQDRVGYTHGYDDIEEGLAKILYGAMGLGGVSGAFVGLTKVNDCRAFNARLVQERRGDEQASHEWLNELFPLPDLGVTGLDPVFGVPIN